MALPGPRLQPASLQTWEGRRLVRARCGQVVEHGRSSLNGDLLAAQVLRGLDVRGVAGLDQEGLSCLEVRDHVDLRQAVRVDVLRADDDVALAAGQRRDDRVEDRVHDLPVSPRRAAMPSPISMSDPIGLPSASKYSCGG